MVELKSASNLEQALVVILKDLQFEIKTGKANAADFKATIQKETANAEELTAKVEDLFADIAADEAVLKEATGSTALNEKGLAKEHLPKKEGLAKRAPVQK